MGPVRSNPTRVGIGTYVGGRTWGISSYLAVPNEYQYQWWI